MSLPRFFADALSPGRITLSEAESRHAQSARRLSAGDPVALFDGRGNEAGATVLAGSSRRNAMEAEVGEVIHRPRAGIALTLAVAMPKGPRQDWLIEKCTELGVAALIPLVTERSVSGASAHRLTKWRQICIEAAKQSGQAWIPELGEACAFQEMLGRLPAYDRTWLLAADGEPAGEITWSPRTLMLIGPEGDFCAEERQRAVQAGATPLSLGRNILRIETAALGAAALAHASSY